MASDPPISEEDLKKAVVEMATALAQFNTKYAVIGGMATAYRSQPRSTKDLDILLAIPPLALHCLINARLGSRIAQSGRTATTCGEPRQGPCQEIPDEFPLRTTTRSLTAGAPSPR